MSYAQTRDDEQLSKLDNAIIKFIARYNSKPSSANRKTIILFPGGMASQLLRASRAEPHGPPYLYKTMWLDCSIFSGAALDLQMQGDVDNNQQVVIPDGPVGFMTLRPYAGFVQWCEAMGIDYFIFGWDWRRGLKLTVDFFLNVFLPLFRQRVQPTCSPDPLRHFALVGHSFGGMIVKLILNKCNNSYVQLMKHAVTVATPFYGYGGQVARYFIGDPDLTRLGYGKRELTRAVSSLAAGYALMFLDEDTYNRHGPALSRDPDYPLTAYPSKDATYPAQVADPYNPKTSRGNVRYPQNYGFDLVKLSSGKTIYQEVAAPLDPMVNTKFFNIRGVQVENGTIVNKTVNRQAWDWIAPTFDPETDPSPITDYLGPGDGTLPAWSARLVCTPAANVRTLRGAIEHMYMMSNPLILDELAMVISYG